jgi:serine/threonine-protein kinase RsbW
MISKTQRLAVTLETLLESVDLAENIVVGVAESAGFSNEDVHKIGMAVREGVVNAYNYGNQQDQTKKISIAVEFDPGKMTIRILDEGPGFELTEVPDCLAEENLLRTSGRGLFLMRAFMDDFKVLRSLSGGAELVMVKNLPSSGSSNGSSQPK